MDVQRVALFCEDEDTFDSFGIPETNLWCPAMAMATSGMMN
jgi:hypothetical protein